MIEFSDADYERISSYFHYWIGFTLTKKQLMEILHENVDIAADIKEMGPDTSNREAFQSALGKKITGKDWPIGMTPQDEMKQFFRDMEVKGKAMGYNVPDGYGDR